MPLVAMKIVGIVEGGTTFQMRSLGLDALSEKNDACPGCRSRAAPR